MADCLQNCTTLCAQRSLQGEVKGNCTSDSHAQIVAGHCSCHPSYLVSAINLLRGHANISTLTQPCSYISKVGHLQLHKYLVNFLEQTPLSNTKNLDPCSDTINFPDSTKSEDHADSLKTSVITHSDLKIYRTLDHRSIYVL